jgi:hypothetical protein
MRPADRTIHEVVMCDWRKLVIDIDDASDPSLHLFDFERHIKARIRDVFTALDIGVPETTVYHMVDEFGDVCYNKLSYHVVVSNFLFTAATCKGLCMIISSGQVWDKCTDIGVYKSVQCIRIEGSTKFGEKRWKHVCIDEEGFTPCTNNGYALERGLVSYTKDIAKSNFMCDPVIRLFNSVLPLQGLNGHPFDCADMSQFRVARNRSYSRLRGNGSLLEPLQRYVSLHRTKPGYCHQCNRMHHRENAAIRYVKGQPTFVCWRYATC